MAENPPTILVVDDDENNRYTLIRRLGREGYTEVVEAHDGLQALNALATRPVDLILLDVMMPKMDGYQVLEHLKAEPALRDIPVIMISAVDALESVVRCIELGAEDYLQKPFNATLLRARIGASLEKKRLRDQAAAHLQAIEAERLRADDLLHAILPAGAVQELKITNAVKPRRYDNVAVLFCDIVEFTAYCDRNPPEQVVSELQGLIERFEDIIAQHRMEKIKTIGDAFLATAGLLQRVEDPLLTSLRCGLAMVEAAKQAKPHWGVRVGVHHGMVVAGIVGRRQFLFDLWGDTVNTAARITACADVNSVFVSQHLWHRVGDQGHGTSRGSYDLKGKGRIELVHCHAML